MKDSIFDEFEMATSKLLLRKINLMESQEILALDEISQIGTINKKILCSDSKKFMGFCKQPCISILESLSNNEEIFYLFYQYLKDEVNSDSSLPKSEIIKM